MCRSLLAPQFLSDFSPIPDFALIPPPPPIFHCDGKAHGLVSVYCLRSLDKESAREMIKLGGVGWGHVGVKKLGGCARKCFLARNLLRQAEAQYRFPVRFLFPQGTGEASSANNVGL